MSSFVETLYYQIYNCSLLGNLKKAKMYLEFLREEYVENESKFDILKNDNRWQYLMELGKSIDDNCVYSKAVVVEEERSKVVRQENETIFSKQDDLVAAIMLCQNDLRTCISAESDFYCAGVEVYTRYGRVDLVAQDSKTIFPIEVKKNGAFHDVIGQINKYVLHYKLGLINRLYENVVGIVIANSFDKFALKEMRKFEILPIKYKFKTEFCVEFEKIN